MKRLDWTPGDENVARLLGQAYDPPPVSAEFAERVQACLLEVAANEARRREPLPRRSLVLCLFTSCRANGGLPMKKKTMRGIIMASSALLLLAGIVIANPNWSPNSPSQGLIAGTIMVQGNFTLEGNYVTTGAARVAAWPVGGGQEVVFSFELQPGQSGTIGWGPWAVMGLTSGQPYNVNVQIDVMDSITHGTATYQTDTAAQTPP